MGDLANNQTKLSEELASIRQILFLHNETDYRVSEFSHTAIENLPHVQPRSEFYSQTMNTHTPCFPLLFSGGFNDNMNAPDTSSHENQEIAYSQMAQPYLSSPGAVFGNDPSVSRYNSASMQNMSFNVESFSGRVKPDSFTSTPPYLFLDPSLGFPANQNIVGTSSTTPPNPQALNANHLGHPAVETQRTPNASADKSRSSGPYRRGRKRKDGGTFHHYVPGGGFVAENDMKNPVCGDQTLSQSQEDLAVDPIAACPQGHNVLTSESIRAIPTPPGYLVQETLASSLELDAITSKGYENPYQSLMKSLDEITSANDNNLDTLPDEGASQNDKDKEWADFWKEQFRG